jgi:hypothetical protein
LFCPELAHCDCGGGATATAPASIATAVADTLNTLRWAVHGELTFPLTLPVCLPAVYGNRSVYRAGFRNCVALLRLQSIQMIGPAVLVLMAMLTAVRRPPTAAVTVNYPVQPPPKGLRSPAGR